MSEDLEEELARRALEIARPAAPLVRERRAALLLVVGTDRVLLPAEAARAVAPLAHLTPIPFAEPHVAGLTARRGRAIPVFHLRVLLGLPLSQLPETSRVIVLDAPGEPALAVDAIGDDDLPDDEALRPPPETMAAASRALVRGTTEDGRLVLDVTALISSPRLTIDVGPRAARR
ncbi:chemotaxis protein CheW [Sandaracinus amylolyticus]|uniref:chemotaxis protein CheW n=1 Tax=Sandaracinus amylolyticus TaxID=927083 RepID=UPI001F26E4CC|nr:chemotaxis protein CheW [Sandaracinus amylolyticus]UJR81324.1 Positive regulator of CheA protein activity [Sandaracinus amylolyticus]